MSFLTTLIIALIAIAIAAWVFRFAGQKVTENKPFFRDMPYAVTFGYVLAVALLLLTVWYYFQPTTKDGGVPNPGVIFFRWAVNGLLFFSIVAFLFRFLGRNVGTEGTKKLFRSMPLTASFGVITILFYAFVSIFAGQIGITSIVVIAVIGLAAYLLTQRASGRESAQRIGIIFGAFVVLMVIMYFVGGIAPHGQEEIFPRANIAPGGNPALGGDPEFPLGTDQIGRDIYSRLIFGAQNTVGIAFATTCLAFAVGATLGFLAATLGGWLDNFISRAVDVLMAIPALIFALLLMTIAIFWANTYGIDRTYFMVVIIALIDSTRVYRLARAVGQNIVVMDYIEAAKLRGERLGYLVFKEILPNATAPLLAEFGLRFCFVFLTIAALSFLGVGIQPPLADWGTMVKDLSLFINYAAFAPNVAAAPLLAAGAIALLTVAVNFVVDWMLHKSSGLKE